MLRMSFWVTAGLLLTIVPAFAANIVTNPDFESGLSGWTTHACTDPSCTIFGPTGWTVNTLDPHTGTGAANSGCVGALCLDPVAGDWIAQTLTTVPSTTYTLTFWMDPAGYPNNSAVEIDAFWNGALVGVFTSEPDGYHQYTIGGLLATSTSTVLEFTGRHDPYFAFIDDIAVDDVPEPLSFLLSGLGLGLLGMLKARRVH